MYRTDSHIEAQRHSDPPTTKYLGYRGYYVLEADHLLHTHPQTISLPGRIMDNGFPRGSPHSGQESPWGSPYYGTVSPRESISHADRLLSHRLLRPVQSPVPGQYEFPNSMSNIGIANSTTRTRTTPLPVPRNPTQTPDIGFVPGDNGFDEEDEVEADDDDEDKETMKRERDASRSISVPLSGFRPHAAVEKRYRRTVNAKLQQLYTMIPPSGKFSLESSQRFDATTANNGTEQAAKPVVLDKTIQYVTHLIGTYQKYDEDIRSLRQQVRDLLGEEGLSETTGPHLEAGNR